MDRIWGRRVGGGWPEGKTWVIEFARITDSAGLAPCQSNHRELLESCFREARRAGEQEALKKLFKTEPLTHSMRISVQWPEKDRQILYVSRFHLSGLFWDWSGRLIDEDKACIEMVKWCVNLLSHPKYGARANSQQSTPGDYTWKYWCQSLVVIWQTMKQRPNKSTTMKDNRHSI